MKILLIADPIIPVPPKCYGGAERVVATYAEEFQRLGHHVELLAGPGSKLLGSRVHLHRAPSKRYLSRVYRKIRFQLQSMSTALSCDVVYNHGRFDYLELLLAMRKPLLNLFHNDISQEQINFAEHRIRSASAFHFISASQKSHAKVSVPSFIIPNPINARHYSAGDEPRDYLVFLGRLTSNKGVDVAISVARRTGHRLVIAGNISSEPADKRFFYTKVQPFIDGDQIRWIGPVDDRMKRGLLSKASALLFPIRWDEPFGIVMIEALACGCPVIATRRASTPEVIDHGVTGWLCEPHEPSVDAFVEAVNRLSEINPQVCRSEVERRFDVRVVAPQVLEVLQKLANREAIR